MESVASNFTILFAGTGGSWPTPGRGLPAVVLRIGSTTNLLDCGEGTQKQLMKSNISFMSVNNIFISHFHGDHFLGLPGMVQSMSFNGRTEELNIYGPGGAIRILSNLLGAGYYRLGFNIRVTEFLYDKEYEFPEFIVKTFKNDHPVPALSFRFQEGSTVRIDGEKAREMGVPVRRLEELRKNGEIEVNGRKFYLSDISAGIRKGRSVVYTGDTRPVEGMKDFARDADVLIHDTTTDSSIEERTNEYGHTTSRQAAEIAKAAGVRKLFLFHYSPRYGDYARLVEEAKEVFPESEPSREMLEYDIKVRRD